MIRFILTGLILVTAVSAQTNDEMAIRDLISKYVDAREKIDPAATQDLFTEEADQLVSTGEWRKGRDKLVAGAMQSSRTSQGKRTITADTIRLITPTVAIVDGPYTIEASGTSPVRKMRATFVVVKNEKGWQISAIRNMLPTSNQ